MSSPMLILLSICILIQGTLADNFTDTVVGGERVKRSLDKCITCICNVESGGCRAIGCNMDEGSLSCGYFQVLFIIFVVKYLGWFLDQEWVLHRLLQARNAFGWKPWECLEKMFGWLQLCSWMHEGYYIFLIC